MKKALFLLSISILILSCGGSKEVKMGDQIWMGENLDVTTFRNGVEIPQAKTEEEFNNAGYDQKPAWCYYEFDSDYDFHGKLYNWYAVSDPRGLAPEGWHIPAVEEFEQLKNYVGTLENGSASIKSTKYWAVEEKGVFGAQGSPITNSSGFNALPSGEYSAGFKNASYRTIYWSSTGVKLDFSEIIGKAKVLYLSVYNDDVEISAETATSGYSVRCIKD